MLRRVIVRLTNTYILRHIGLLSQLFDQDVVKGLVFLAICDANVGYIDHVAETSHRYAGLDALTPDDLRRPIRPHKLALSLGLPRETARRKVNALIAEGWLTETEQGVIASGQAVNSDGMRRALAVNSALVVDLYANLARAGFDCPAPPAAGLGEPPLPHRAIARITAGYCLRSMDELRGLFGGDLLTGLIFSAIVDANSAYLDKQDQVVHADLDDHVPDDLRRPTSALAVALRLNLPRETVRRHIRRLEAMGACATVRGGVIVPQATLMGPQIVDATVRNAANLRKLLNELQAAGFPPALWSAQPQAARREAAS